MNDWSMLRKLIWLHVISGGGSSGARTTVTGVSPLALANALAKPIRSLIQYGKVTTSNGEMYCNNGKLVAVDDELSVVGTPEVLTVGEQTASVENLFAVDDIKDEQNIISGTIARRCEAVVSDGTTPSGRYIGEVGEGNIIVKVRETGYEGDVATFEADRAKPLNGLTVNVEPIQDLHGYDSPWPAGGGKNLLRVTAESATINGIQWTVDKDAGGNVVSITANGTSTGRSIFLLWFDYAYLSDYGFNGDYILSGTASNNCRIMLQAEGSGNIIDAGSSVQFSTESLTQKYRFVCEVPSSGTTFSNAKIYPMVRLAAETDATFSPYSNICPISGRTSATVTRTGRNLLGLNSDNFDSAGSNVTVDYLQTGVRVNNSIVYANTNAKWVIHGLAKMLSGKAVNLSFNVNTSSDNTGGYIVRTQTNGTVVTNYIRSNTNIAGGTFINTSFTIPNDGAEDICFIFYAVGRTTPSSGDTAYTEYTNIQLELGSTASAYEPYTANTYTIQIGDTVYGGQLDVTGGKMVVDMVGLDMGSVNWSKNTVTQGTLWRHMFDDMESVASTIKADILCSLYPTVPQTQRAENTLSANNKNVDVIDSDYSTAADFKAAVTGQTIVYPLATPLEITLTPMQIETLLGTNNIWSDAGSVKAYVADGDVIEHVTAQPMRTAEGSNTVSVTSAVAPVQLSATYTRAET